MLEIIRKNAASWLMKFILGAIVVVFIFWGVGTFRSGRLDVMAKVNGEKILVEEFQKAYNSYVERLRKMYGGNIPDALFKRLKVKENVLNQLIDNVLIRQEARRIGLKVTDKELQQVILNIPAFKQGGVFDKRLYQMALRNAHLTPVDFENQLRDEMLSRKLQFVMSSGLYCPDNEALSFFKYQNAKLDVEYLKIDASSCVNDVNATDKKLKEWFEKHKERFRTDPQVRLKYLLFSKDEFERAANVTKKEIKEYYNEHLSEFHVPEKRKARHILIKVPRDANATVVEAAKKKIEDLKKKIEKGSSFEDLAKKFSQDEASAKNGGDLGYFTKGTMVKPFDEKVFSMKKGEVAGPVRTVFGWHLIKLEDIKKEYTKPLKEVEKHIAKILKDKKAKKLMWDEANKAYDMIIELGSLEAYAKTSGKKLKETGLFPKESPDPVIGFKPQVLDMIFSLDKGELSSLLEVPKGVMVAELVEKRPPYIPKFEEVKAKVEDAYTEDESLDLCKKKAEKILEMAKKKGIKEVAKKYNLKVKDTGFYKRTDQGAGGKLPFPVAQGALSLSKKKPYPEKVFQSGRSFYIVHLKGFKEDADMKEFSKEKDKIKKRIAASKAQIAFSSWLKHQRETAKIEIIRKP